MSHFNLELIPIKSINKPENNSRHTFTVRRCHIKWVADEWCNKLTMHWWIESKVHWIKLNWGFPESPSSTLKTCLCIANCHVFSVICCGCCGLSVLVLSLLCRVLFCCRVREWNNVESFCNFVCY